MKQKITSYYIDVKNDKQAKRIINELNKELLT